MDDEVTVVRAFNRAYAKRIGVHDESYLGTGRAYGPARLLYEIPDGGAGVGDLRASLELDSGYVSRLLRQLEHDGLVTVERDSHDGRKRVVRLTAAGRRERARLDDRSERLVSDLLDPLSPRLRGELASALAAAERIVRAATARFTVVDPGCAAARSALDRYFAELDGRFRSGFDPDDAGASGDGPAMRPPDGAFVVVRSDDDVIGCGGVQSLDDVTGEVKRMWIHRDWRGLGLGARLLARLEDECRRLGRRRVVLDTNESLSEAIALYGRAGYHAIERYNDNPYAHHWFAKVLDPFDPGAEPAGRREMGTSGTALEE